MTPKSSPMPQTGRIQKAVEHYHNAGFSCVPVLPTKLPAVAWKELQFQQSTDLSIYKTSGIAFATGFKDLEVIDLDLKYDITGTLKQRFEEKIGKEVVDKLVIQSTKNGGYHYLYRCLRIEGNLKLASRKATDSELSIYNAEVAAENVKRSKTGKGLRNFKSDGAALPKVLIETRGTGGYVLVYPSQGYNFVQGTPNDVQYITEDERDIIIQAAKSFDEIVPVKPIQKTTATRALTAKEGSDRFEISTFDDFNQRGDVVGLLEKHGWSIVNTQGQRVHLKRPGNTDAKTSGNFHLLQRVFYVFTSSTEFEPNRGYNASQVYTTLEHRGDFSAAAKQLFSEGFGKLNINNRLRPAKTSEIRTLPKPTQAATKKSFNIFDHVQKTVGKKVDFPIDAIPEPLNNIIKRTAKSLNTPAEFLAASALTAISTTIGNAARVEVIKGWQEPCMLFSAIVGSSSTLKTPSMKWAMKPLWILEEIHEDDYAKDLMQWEIECSTLDKGDTPPEKPIRKDTIIGDSTPEAINKSLSANPKGLLKFHDELKGFVNSMNQYRKGSDIEFWLSTWSNVNAKINRVSKDTLFVKRPFISILGGIQPSVLSSLANNDNDSNGFLFRFLFTFVENDVKKHLSKEPYNVEDAETYSNIVLSLASLIYDENEDLVFNFSVEAQKLFEKWYNKNADLINEAKHEHIKSAYSKLEAYCIRFALIIEMIKVASTGDVSFVSVDSLERAIQLTEYYRYTSQRVYNEITLQSVDEKVLICAEMIGEGKSYALIAKELGISKGTISKWRKKHPHLFV